MGITKDGGRKNKKISFVDKIKKEIKEKERKTKDGDLPQYTNVLKMKLAGCTDVEIAKTNQMPIRKVRNITTQIKQVLSNYCPNQLQAYRDQKISVLEAMEAKFLQYLSCEKKLSKAPLNQVAYAMETIHKIRRLEEGKSTDNSLVVHAISGDKYK